MVILYEHAVDRKIRDMKFSAVLHGADPKDMEDKQYSTTTKSDNLLFGDPAEYAKMSKEDKEELTKKMKGKFTKWAGVRNG